MKNTKILVRAVAMIMAILLCATACGPAQPQKPSSLGDSEYWKLLDKVSDTSELPDWNGDILEISVWWAAGTSKLIGDIADTDVCFKEFERVTGVRFNVDECFDNGGNNIDGKLPMVIASGKLPTMIIGYGIDMQLQELYENGYLADLTKYYENGTLDQMLKYMPLDQAWNYVYENCADENGNLYLIPDGGNAETVNVWDAIGFTHEDYDATFYATYGQSPVNYSNLNSNKAILVRDDILKALYPDALTMKDIENIYMENGTFTEEQIFDLGLDSPEDFWNFLYDLQEVINKEGFVGLDGNKVEVMSGPNTETDNWYWMVNLPQLMNGAPANTEYFLSLDYNATSADNLLGWSFSSDYYVDFMKDLNKLVRDDVIAQNSLLDNSATFKEKCKNGHYAVLYGGQYYPYGDTNDQGWSYRPIWVDTEYNQSQYGGVSTVSYSTYMGIFKDSLTDTQLDQLMHAINYLNSEVGINNFFWGPQSAGLFTVDENGNRSYTNQQLHDCVINNVDNGVATDYGIINGSLAVPLFSFRPRGVAQVIYHPGYLASGTKLNAVDAKKYFCPGILPGESYGENSVFVEESIHIYESGLTIEGVEQFWAARNGFENQMKKVIAADSDEAFNRQLQALITYAEENGLNDETLEEFTEMFLEANEEHLKNAGLIK